MSKEHSQSILEQLHSEALLACHTMKVQVLWEGVIHNKPSDSDLKMLAGFATGLKKIDGWRWEQFKNRLLHSQQLISQFDIQRFIHLNLYDYTDDNKHILWANFAAKELEFLFSYIEKQTTLPYVYEESLNFIKSNAFFEMIANFLREHVGEHKNRVHFEYTSLNTNLKDVNKSRDGLDGPKSTCPVADYDRIMIIYFSHAAATYILMRAIAQYCERFIEDDFFVDDEDY